MLYNIFFRDFGLTIFVGICGGDYRLVICIATGIQGHAAGWRSSGNLISINL